MATARCAPHRHSAPSPSFPLPPRHSHAPPVIPAQAGIHHVEPKNSGQWTGISLRPIGAYAPEGGQYGHRAPRPPPSVRPPLFPFYPDTGVSITRRLQKQCPVFSVPWSAHPTSRRHPRNPPVIPAQAGIHHVQPKNSGQWTGISLRPIGAYAPEGGQYGHRAPRPPPSVRPPTFPVLP